MLIYNNNHCVFKRFSGLNDHFWVQNERFNETRQGWRQLEFGIENAECGKGRACGGLRSGPLVLEESRQRQVDRQTPFS